MTTAFRSAMWRTWEDDEKAYELGLIDHRCKNHLWATYALIESSSREFLPGMTDRLGRIHGQNPALMVRRETKERRFLMALGS